MEPQKSEIIEKAANIILESGLQTLTINNLATELKVHETQLYKQLTNDDDILLMLLLAFETDVIEFVKELVKKGASPESELKLLFKGLYFLFLQKPYYLSIIFDKELIKRDTSIKNSFIRIRNIAKNYLTGVIDAGKNENTFKTKEPTAVLVNKLLSGFRFLMQEDRRVNEMILELKTLKTLKD